MPIRKRPPGWLQGSDAEGVWLGVAPCNAHQCTAPHTVCLLFFTCLTPLSDRGLCPGREGSAALTAGSAGTQRCPFHDRSVQGPGDDAAGMGPCRYPWMGQPGRCCCVSGCREELGGRKGPPAVGRQALSRRQDQGNFAGAGWS